jgi:hypothetical protein
MRALGRQSAYAIWPYPTSVNDAACAPTTVSPTPRRTKQAGYFDFRAPPSPVQSALPEACCQPASAKDPLHALLHYPALSTVTAFGSCDIPPRTMRVAICAPSSTNIYGPCLVSHILGFCSAAVQLLQGMPRATRVLVRPVGSASFRPLRPALASAIYRHVAKLPLAAATECTRKGTNQEQWG